MRPLLDASKLRRLLEALGGEAAGPGTIYLTGGATALLTGWRETTVDVDLHLDPEPPGIFEAIRRLKHDLDVNIELACPADFIPELPGWRQRSPLIGRHGPVDFRHYDLYAQALSKIERGHARDLRDVEAMLARGLVGLGELRRLFMAIEPGLLRYPAIHPGAFAAKLGAVIGEHPNG
jgi:hypothetical protein